VVENKKKLGAAGAGGGGFLLGWRSEVLLVLFAGENVEWKINGRCITLCYSFHIFHLVLSFVSGLVATATTGATLKMVDKQIDEYNQNKKKMITDVPE
jgi:NhaP-type Na+/H+ or K+/H+ antiporter